MHVSLQVWFLLMLWIGGLAWALELPADVWHSCYSRWLKCKAMNHLHRSMYRLESKTLRQCAALGASMYACQHLTESVSLTAAQVQELAQGLAKDHVRIAQYTHLSPQEAERRYIATFTPLYWMHRGELFLVVLPLQKSSKRG